MNDILFWVSIVSGGLLILLMLLSLLGGLDIDIDIDSGSADMETDSGGIGFVKGILTFVSTSAWVTRIVILSNKHIGIAILIGVLVGVIFFLLLNYIFKALLQNDSNVNWDIGDAVSKNGKVYLRIPAIHEGSGIVQVNINNAIRELKAISKDHTEIKTGDMVTVVDIDGEYVVVTKNES